MIEKFIVAEELCINIGRPTALGWFLLVVLVLIVLLTIKSRH